MGDSKAELRSRPRRRAYESTVRPGARAGIAGALSSGRRELLDGRVVLQLQRTVGNASVQRLLAGPAPSPAPRVEDVVGAGRGSPLESSLRARLEGLLGEDFGSVRIHTDAGATASARSLDAHAYTVGEDVVVQRGRYDPHTTAGLRLLAHELTHVLQQRSGPVSGVPTEDGLTVSVPSDPLEREAERVAERVVQ